MTPADLARHRWTRLVVRARRPERGSATVQLVVLMPAMFALMFLGMQAALTYHGRTVAIAAAEEGSRAAGALGASSAAGRVAAFAFVASAGGDGVLTGVRVSITRTATTATVVVTGSTPSVIPGWHPTVTQSSSSPLERITR